MENTDDYYLSEIVKLLDEISPTHQDFIERELETLEALERNDYLEAEIPDIKKKQRYYSGYRS